MIERCRIIKYWTVKDVDRNALEAEARRIETGPKDSEHRLGICSEKYEIICPGNADLVLSRARQVMRLVNESSLAECWPEDEEWFERLPDWFSDACRPEDDNDDDDPDPLGPELSQEERRAQYFASKWQLTSWISWVEPEERLWMWWSAHVHDTSTIHVKIDALGDPSRLGSPPGLWWLFAAAGASEYDQV